MTDEQRTSKEQLDRDWTAARAAWPKHHTRRLFIGCDTDNSWMAGYRAALADLRAAPSPPALLSKDELIRMLRQHGAAQAGPNEFDAAADTLLGLSPATGADEPIRRYRSTTNGMLHAGEGEWVSWTDHRAQIERLQRKLAEAEAELERRQAKIMRLTPEPGQLQWISLSERMPPENGGKILVTNNLEATDAFGHKSHVWLVNMVHRHKPGDKTIFGDDAYEEHGEFSAFNKCDVRIRGLTHWADPFAVSALPPDEREIPMDAPVRHFLTRRTGKVVAIDTKYEIEGDDGEFWSAWHRELDHLVPEKTACAVWHVAQHEETGRMWWGPKDQIPKGYTDLGVDPQDDDQPASEGERS